MRRPAGIRRKLWVVFVMQLAAISFATVLSVYGAATILEDVLIKQALKEEAFRPASERDEKYTCGM